MSTAPRHFKWAAWLLFVLAIAWNIFNGVQSYMLWKGAMTMAAQKEELRRTESTLQRSLDALNKDMAKRGKHHGSQKKG